MIRCTHCGLLHVSSRTVCPTTGLAIAGETRGTSRRDGARMTARPTRSAPPSERSLVGVTLDGKYRVTSVIGQGGMGTVYEAEHLAIGRRVAVKVLQPDQAKKKEAVERLRHEARVVGQIGHPNICQVFDIGQLEDGVPYLVMERLNGRTLASRLEEGGPVPAPEMVEITIQVLAALEAAHRKNVVHRDMKPDNIFLAERASGIVAKVLDFGISKATGPDDLPHHLTRTGMVMGTPYYMAPEQAMGERGLDGRVDVWGMGVVLYEALGGRRPFVAKNYNALLVQILTAEPPPLLQLVPGLAPELGAIVLRCLAKKREDRFQSARELSEALVPFRGSKTAPPPRPMRRTERLVGPAAVGAAGRARNPSTRPPPRADATTRDLGPRGTVRAGQPTRPPPNAPRGGKPVFEEDRWDETGSSDEEPTMVIARRRPGEDETPTFEDNEHTIVDDPPSFTDIDSETETGRRRL